MTAIQVRLRNKCKDVIDIAKTAGQLNINDFDTINAFFPRKHLEQLVEKPLVCFVAIGFKTDRQRLLRDLTLEVEVPCQISVMQKTIDETRIEALVELCEGIMGKIEDDFELTVPTRKFSWERTEPLRDEHGLAYSYEDLTNLSVFMAVFTPVYKTIIARS
jgi:hypothetical protein